MKVCFKGFGASGCDFGVYYAISHGIISLDGSEMLCVAHFIEIIADVYCLVL